MKELRTLKGSVIKRAGDNVGKEISGKLYFHRQYWEEYIDPGTWERILSAADTEAFLFDCVMVDLRSGKVRLDEAPDFDTAREPTVGKTLTYMHEGEVKLGASCGVWHHKWLWVKDDYEGFDVEEAYNWSFQWLQTLTEPAKGGSIKAWETQLMKFGLPLEHLIDEPVKPDLRVVKDHPSPSMNVQTWSSDKIHPYHRNPRDNASAIQKVAVSLKEYGWQQPIVVDSDGVIIVGHTRYLAALSLAWLEMPVIVADKLTPAQVKAYRIADNKVGEAAEWNDELLRLEITDLGDMDVTDLTQTGFAEDEIQKLFVVEEPPEKRDDGEYGGATALSRGSSPLRYYRNEELLQGAILDYGCGKEEHEFEKYDMITHPDPEVLLIQYDTVMCNYVLNVQPSDHLIDLILVNIYHLLKPGGTALIAVVSEAALSGTAACGNREHKTPKQWQQILAQFFNVTLLQGSFTGYCCRRYD
jgi:hypothetical protein